MKINPTPHVSCKYGAPMGRPAFGHGADPTTPFSLRLIPINQGGYDRGGAYWGVGSPLYWYCAYEKGMIENGPCEYCNQSVRDARYTECDGRTDAKHVHPMIEEEVEISDYIRASNREQAKSIITAKYPTATFYR